MKKIANFFEHIYTAARWGEWCFGFDNYENKPKLSICVMPYDGWNFSVHVLSFYLCVNYPWCGDID